MKKDKTSKEYPSETNDKIIASMDLVYEKLVEYKRKINSELVIMQDGKIVHVKPYLPYPINSNSKSNSFKRFTKSLFGSMRIFLDGKVTSKLSNG